MSRQITCAVVLGILAGAPRAQAQTQRNWDITHTIHIPDGPTYGVDSVTAKFFDHVWSVHPFGGPAPQWQAAPPWTTPPAWPSNPQQQPPGFDAYGTELLYRHPGVAYYGPFTWPYNTCLPGYNYVNPCWSAKWPPQANPLSTGNLLILEAGTGPDWDIEVDVGGFPATFARSEIEVQPFQLGQGRFDARIRSAGADHVQWSGWGLEHTYAFSWTQLQLARHVRPQIAPPGVILNYGVNAIVNAGTNTSPATFWPSGVRPMIQSFYDPITFVATELATGEQRTGELFQLVVDLAGGWCNASNGTLAFDTQEGGLRVRMDHPFINPRGTLDIELSGGLVVTSRATGCFASVALPPVGSPTPVSVNFPSSTFDFVFDATSVFPGDHDVTFQFGGAGGEQRPASLAMGACCDNGNCTSGTYEGNCVDAGGTWQGADTACTSAPYQAEEFRGGFEDIAPVGIPSVAGNCDDCGETVPLGFTFDYFGVPMTDVGIASNGYLAFSGPLDDWTNDPIPTSSGPQGVIAGYWDDLNPLASGDVHYATLGASPARRFVAQWTDVPHYLTDYPPHTFQIVLYEGTNEIELIHLDAPVVGGLISPTIGLEDPAGAAGLVVDPELVTPKGSRRFTPAPGLTCSAPAAVPYCTAGTTSNGCLASMSSSGTPSVSQSSGFVVSCNAVEGQKQGILFYGVSGPAALSWGGGSSFLCIKAPYQRTGASNSGGTAAQCDGALSVDLLAYLAAHPTALGAPFSAGQQCWTQAWFRDPPTSKTTSLSNGLAITFHP